MLYLSLVLIVAGLMMLLFGLYSGMKRPVFSPESSMAETPRRVFPDPPHTPTADRRPVREPAVSGDTAIDLSFEKPEPGEDDGGILDELNAHYDSHEEQGGDEAPAGHAAVLFEDASGLINYEDGSPIIDSSLDGYRKLKRVGAGRVEMASEGINFHTGKSFFRYDFRKVETLKIGRNYFVLFIQGSPAARLFLFDAETPFLHQVRKGLEIYLKDAG